MYKSFRITNIATVFIIISLLGCSSADDTKYVSSIDHWHQLRIDYLKGETGFLNLAGLYWLDQGTNNFGSSSINKLIFPALADSLMGSFLLKDSLVYLIPFSEIKIGGNVVLDTTLVFGAKDSPVMEYKSFRWFIIKRGTSIGVRLRDFNHPLLQNFDSIDYYTTNPTYKVEATWQRYDEPKTVTFANVLNMAIDYPVYGAFRFLLEGKEIVLEPMGEPDTELGYFVMFYDKTSGHATYGSGRYLYVNPPNKLGRTIIDFNKAFNPPCAFTEFATCLFPHKQNRLSIFVKAGEKFSGH